MAQTETRPSSNANAFNGGDLPQPTGRIKSRILGMGARILAAGFGATLIASAARDGIIPDHPEQALHGILDHILHTGEGQSTTSATADRHSLATIFAEIKSLLTSQEQNANATRTATTSAQDSASYQIVDGHLIAVQTVANPAYHHGDMPNPNSPSATVNGEFAVNGDVLRWSESTLTYTHQVEFPANSPFASLPVEAQLAIMQTINHGPNDHFGDNPILNPDGTLSNQVLYGDASVRGELIYVLPPTAEHPNGEAIIALPNNIFVVIDNKAGGIVVSENTDPLWQQGNDSGYVATLLTPDQFVREANSYNGGSSLVNGHLTVDIHPGSMLRLSVGGYNRGFSDLSGAHSPQEASQIINGMSTQERASLPGVLIIGSDGEMQYTVAGPNAPTLNGLEDLDASAHLLNPTQATSFTALPYPQDAQDTTVK